MSGPSGKHRSPRRQLGGWAPDDLALTDEAARSVGESWSEWMRRVAVEAAREELAQTESAGLSEEENDAVNEMVWSGWKEADAIREVIGNR
jgi:uncharacterized protein (DUF1778 family)